MESLLSSYGSDDDSENEVKTSQHAHIAPGDSHRHPSLFSSLPTPQSHQRAINETPKISSTKSDLLHVKQEPEANALASPAAEQVEGVARPSLFSTLPKPLKRERPIFDEQEDLKASTTLFSKLPAPKSEGIPPGGMPKSKKTILFRPPINTTLLEQADEDDRKPAKKLVKAAPTEGKSGLAAFLPPPKHGLGSGTALGGGQPAGARRTTMSLAQSDSEPAVLASQAGKDSWHQGGAVSNEQAQNYVHPASQYAVDYSHHVPAEYVQNPPEGAQLGDAYGTEHSTPNWGSGDTYLFSPHDQHAPGQTSAFGVAAASVEFKQEEDLLAKAMTLEGKRGGMNLMTQVVEVKQQDLTKGRLREDQLRTTGIAFGPAHKPVASASNKPSKMHRRKHQIGALFFDMKQREMEQAERHAKGLLSKAETHAKYGW